MRMLFVHMLGVTLGNFYLAFDNVCCWILCGAHFMYQLLLIHMSRITFKKFVFFFLTTFWSIFWWWGGVRVKVFLSTALPLSKCQENNERIHSSQRVARFLEEREISNQIFMVGIKTKALRNNLPFGYFLSSRVRNLSEHT